MVIGDLHCDLPYKVYKFGKTLDNYDLQWSLNYIAENNSFIQVFATCVEDDEELNSFNGASLVINRFKKQLEKFNVFVSANSFSENKVNAILSLEGASALQGEIGNVQKFYHMGVRLITLTWNYENELGFGAVTGIKKGLKPFGREVIKEMNRLKMAVDVSHLNEEGFWDACELSQIPVIASHSNSKSLCDNPRNLTDSQFVAIKNKGGIVGLNVYPPFLNNTQNAVIKDIINHLEHFLALGGEDTVCFGCDFDGIDVTAKNFENISCYPDFINELLKLNFSEKLIAKICYENIKNYFNQHIFEFF